HLFERFFRVDGARSTRGNGSGLGLAIVKWIVQQHGGSVDVESRLGEGTVFTVNLPALEVRNTMDLATNVRATLVENVIARVRPQ
ncbi:MAG TPA: ATP-binding protein, partial [Trueperaceae bacterium]|nr:ATP-binding protein [Trueperaceae bacterium]